MSFEQELRELVSRVEGADGAIFLDADGEAVQWCAKDDGARLKLRAAYLAVVLQACRASAARMELGRITHLVMQYDGATFVIEELEAGYFIALELNSSANVGQALFRIQPTVVSLRREIAA